MFLVRRAAETMDKDIVVAAAQSSFEELLARPDNDGRLRHVVVEDSGHIIGVLRVNTALRTPAPGTSPAVPLGQLASRQFTIVREDDVAFDVIRRMWRRGAMMALVVPQVKGSPRAVPRATDVLGVITKEHVADSVASSIRVYPMAS